MNKFLAIVKREYLERVRSKMFVIATILGPLLMGVLAVAPAMLLRMKTGDATRLAVVDQTGNLYSSVSDAIRTVPRDEPSEATTRRNDERRDMSFGRFEIEQVSNVENLDETRAALIERIKQKNLDAFIVLPADVLTSGKVTYYGRNTGDVFSTGQIENRINDAIIRQRFINAGLDSARIDNFTRNIEMSRINAIDSKEDSGGGFLLAYGVGFLIYFLIIIYGGIILSAVVEEKTTRIAEVLFSSADAFTLLAGKLIGVSLVALTQVFIWGATFTVLGLYGATTSGALTQLPLLSPVMLLYLLLFFLCGYLIYSTMYALVGAMVTTTQEGQQLSMPVVIFLVAAFFLSFSVIRSPSSSFSIWVSMIPFFSPITMLVRIVTETPPFWQIALSLVIGFATVVGLLWLAARVYRTGMLMYGKRATIPEMLKWVRQS